MQTHDWINAGFLLVFGVFLGFVVDGILQLATTSFWPLAIILLLMVAGIFLFELLMDKLFSRIFPIGVRPANKSPAQGRKPLPVFLSLPAGVILGIALARLGLADTILGVIL
jgi:hypothetical protein